MFLFSFPQPQTHFIPFSPFQKVPVTFLNGGYKLGFLDPVRHDAQDDVRFPRFLFPPISALTLFFLFSPLSLFLKIQEDEESDLPLWLARGLSNKNHVTVALPKKYGKGVQNALQADASIVSFKSGPYYYDGLLSFFFFLFFSFLFLFLFFSFSHFSFLICYFPSFSFPLFFLFSPFSFLSLSFSFFLFLSLLFLFPLTSIPIPFPSGLETLRSSRRRRT